MTLRPTPYRKRWLIVFAYTNTLFSCNHQQVDLEDCWSYAPANYRKYTQQQPNGSFLGEKYNQCLFRNIAESFSQDNARGIVINLRDTLQHIPTDTTKLSQNELTQILAEANWRFIRVAVLGGYPGEKTRDYQFDASWRKSTTLSSGTIYTLHFYLIKIGDSNWIPDTTSKHINNLVLKEVSADWNEQDVIENTDGIWPQRYSQVAKPPFQTFYTQPDSNILVVHKTKSTLTVVCGNDQADSLWRYLLKEFEFMPFLTTKRENFRSLFTETGRPLPSRFESMSGDSFAVLLKSSIDKYWRIETCTLGFASKIPWSVRMKLIPKDSHYHSKLYAYCGIKNQQWFLMYGIIPSTKMVDMPLFEKQLFGE